MSEILSFNVPMWAILLVLAGAVVLTAVEYWIWQREEVNDLIDCFMFNVRIISSLALVGAIAALVASVVYMITLPTSDPPLWKEVVAYAPVVVGLVIMLVGLNIASDDSQKVTEFFFVAGTCVTLLVMFVMTTHKEIFLGLSGIFVLLAIWSFLRILKIYWQRQYVREGK